MRYSKEVKYYEDLITARKTALSSQMQLSLRKQDRGFVEQCIRQILLYRAEIERIKNIL